MHCCISVHLLRFFSFALTRVTVNTRWVRATSVYLWKEENFLAFFMFLWGISFMGEDWNKTFIISSPEPMLELEKIKLRKWFAPTVISVCSSDCCRHSMLSTNLQRTAWRNKSDPLFEWILGGLLMHMVICVTCYFSPKVCFFYISSENTSAVILCAYTNITVGFLVTSAREKGRCVWDVWVLKSLTWQQCYTRIPRVPGVTAWTLYLTVLCFFSPFCIGEILLPSYRLLCFLAVNCRFHNHLCTLTVPLLFLSLATSIVNCINLVMVRQKNKCATMRFHNCCAQIPNRVKVCAWIPGWVRGHWLALLWKWGSRCCADRHRVSSVLSTRLYLAVYN